MKTVRAKQEKINKLFNLLFILVVTLSGLSHAQDSLNENVITIVSKSGPETAELLSNEKVHRQAQEILSQNDVAKAVEQYYKNNFPGAKELLLRAKNRLLNYSKSSARISGHIKIIDETLYNLHADWAKALAYEAKRELKPKLCDEAIKKCKQAQDYFPEKAPELDKIIVKYQELKSVTELRRTTNPKKSSPGKKELEYDIKVLLAQAEIYMKHRRYSDARDYYEQVLIKDPYNREAINGKRRIYESLYNIANSKIKTIRTSGGSTVESRWACSNVPAPLTTGPQATGNSQPVKKPAEKNSLKDKLDTIIFPVIEFDDMPLGLAVGMLVKLSKAHDPTGRGIMIILHVDKNKESNAPEMVNMHLENVPLGEVIRFLCLGDQRSFRVDKNAVHITDSSVTISRQ